jgi:hypothetical protein
MGIRTSVAFGALVVVLATSAVRAETITGSLADLEQKTREYEHELTRLLDLQERDAARARSTAERYKTLEPQGFVSKRDVENAERAAAEAQDKARATRDRLADAERVVEEARAMVFLASLPPVAPGEERVTPDVIQHGGATRWTLAQVDGLQRFFMEHFGRPLPVSALGQTAVHDRLGFDHRNALDVAVHPDSVEGRALLEYLRSRSIPFLAFRGPRAGASTGAHVHVGAPSPHKG